MVIGVNISERKSGTVRTKNRKKLELYFFRHQRAQLVLRWGLSTSDCCDCGAEQTAYHITSGRCPIHRPPEGMHGLIELDVKTRTWLENSALDV